jgi:multidrug efflux pump subunit AcrB
MRNPVQKLVPGYNQERGRWATIDRQDIAAATRRAFDGLTVGLYREGDDLYPIIVRNVEREREALADTLDALQIQPELYSRTIPLGEVTDGIDVVWEDPIVHRWQRRRAVSVEAAPKAGVTFPTLLADVRGAFEAIDMPPGYQIFWDGEYDSTVKAQTSLVPGLVPAAVIIALIIVLLYNSVRVLLCILLVVPFSAIGIVYGLWALDSPMGFVAILGVLSLTGMMIKNMIVMTDAITLGVAGGMHPFDACVNASVTTARPIMLAAGTTVLGVIPLLPDPFWSAMAACIMAGLGVGATLTIILYPTLYAIAHGIKRPDSAETR